MEGTLQGDMQGIPPQKSLGSIGNITVKLRHIQAKSASVAHSLLAKALFNRFISRPRYYALKYHGLPLFQSLELFVETLIIDQNQIAKTLVDL